MSSVTESVKTGYRIEGFYLFFDWLTQYGVASNCCFITEPLSHGYRAGLPDDILEYKSANFGKFWRASELKILVYFMTIRYVYIKTIWYIACPFGLFQDHLVYFMTIWSISWPFGILHDHLAYFITIWYTWWLFGIFFRSFGIFF
jgi:hypothetical protein